MKSYWHKPSITGWSGPAYCHRCSFSISGGGQGRGEWREDGTRPPKYLTKSIYYIFIIFCILCEWVYWGSVLMPRASYQMLPKTQPQRINSYYFSFLILLLLGLPPLTPINLHFCFLILFILSLYSSLGISLILWLLRLRQPTDE